MPERRQYPRIPVLIQARIGDPPALWRGYVTDVSLGGLAVVSLLNLCPGEKATIVVEHDKGPIVLGSLIQWCRPIGLIEADVMRYEFGARILKRDDQYRLFVDRLLRDFHDRRRSHRFKESLPVAIRTADELIRECTVNVSDGGIFVCSIHPPDPGATVRLKIDLPGTDAAVVAQGRVIHIEQPDGPRDEARVAGYGVSLDRFENGSGDGFEDFLERLRRRADLSDQP